MSLPVKTQQELYTLFKSTLQSFDPTLTDFNVGSENDTLAGAFSLAGAEFTRYLANQFAKTFFNLTTGNPATNGPDDLQTLAVDHFGSSFARPLAVAAIDTYTFSRLNNAGGIVPILAGTVVKTKPDANGNQQRYTTNATVTLTASGVVTDTSATVGITAVVAGKAGNASAGSISVIESSLLDSSITGSNTGNSTGVDAPDDPTYLAVIRNLIVALAGATTAAIAAQAKTVPGVVSATPVVTMQSVIAYNIATSSTIGTWFMLPTPVLYIADATGTASVALQNAVLAAIESVRACGVIISVKPATAITINWTARFTLNPGGPSYTVLTQNTKMLVDTMTAYINNLPTGSGFTRSTAEAAILAIWGPSGTNDITAIVTTIPSSDTAPVATQKMAAGTVATV